MEWLLPSEALRIMPKIEHGIQLLSFPVNARELIRSLPIPPEIVPPEEGPPSTIVQWYAKLDSLILLIQLQEMCMNSLSTLIAIHTPYTTSVGITEEWQILKNLEKLPASIRMNDPIFISSRHVNATHYVKRRDAQDISQTIYGACSVLDAEGLIAYLQSQGSGSVYEVSAPPECGYWSIVQYGGLTAKIHGAYADMSIAIRTAITMSHTLADDVVLHIQDLSHSPVRTGCRVASGKIL